jgi:ElaA protein
MNPRKEKEMIQWQDLHHSELTVQSLYALLKLRCEVFVVEQTCPYQDIDGDDLTGENRHILGWKDNELVAYARILKSEDDFEPVVIGRVIVSNKARGEKLGYQLMEKRWMRAGNSGRTRRYTWARRRTCNPSTAILVLRRLPTFMTKMASRTSAWHGK